MHRSILIIDDHNDLAESLDEVFTHVGHKVKVVNDRQSALALTDASEYDIVITDLDVDNFIPETPTNGNGSHEGERIKAFKISASNFRREDFNEDELKNFFATILDYKIRFVDKEEFVRDLHENIEFELPSAVSLMHIILEYLIKRVEKLGVCKPEQSNLYIALDEAFVNAVKHGNKFDAKKTVRVTADISAKEARFTIEDQGEGFDVTSIPDPLDPANLFKPSGRGVLFIYNIMDEVKYNERGNRLTMIKKAGQPKEQVT
jgi:serine/threonine-protein kinase RsbW